MKPQPLFFIVILVILLSMIVLESDTIRPSTRVAIVHR